MNAKLVEDYELICEFLLSKAAEAPKGVDVDVNVKDVVGHYATITITNLDKDAAYLRIYDGHGRGPYGDDYVQNYFYEGFTRKDIKHVIDDNRMSYEFMRGLIVGWHKKGIKNRILAAIQQAIDKINLKLDEEKEIENFVV